MWGSRLREEEKGCERAGLEEERVWLEEEKGC